MAAIKNKAKESQPIATGPITRKRGRPAKAEPVKKEQEKLEINNKKQPQTVENAVQDLNVSNNEQTSETLKKRRGRPAKKTTTTKEKVDPSPDTPKRGRGRPRKSTSDSA
ncbi:MAG: hypothetical protein EXX96DRAFT_650514 [Benjaminiella poitrasii]|nr:MAG: hypothetical protein EXX96DRAFT_650514 [Benjaminiella poitrasii]